MSRVSFSLTGLMVATTIVAFLIATATQSWGATVGVVVLLQFLAFGACVETLARNIPSSIARLQRKNCIREDHTWSKRRERIEEKSRNRVRKDLGKAFLLVAIATNIAVWFVHSEVVPIPIALEALSSFSLDEEQWKANLSDDEVRLESWMATQVRLSPSKAMLRKRFLWNSWPIALLLVTMWIVGCIAFVTASYLYSLKDLNASVRFRAEQYRLKALHATVGHDDFAKAKSKSVKQRKRNGDWKSRTKV